MNTENTDPTLLQGLEDSREAAIALITNARHSLDVYTPYLDPRLYDDAQVVAALRNRVVTQPRIQVRMLVPPANEWRLYCPHLLQLVERLTSAITLRTLPKIIRRERPELAQTLMIADQGALMFLADPRRMKGSYTSRGSAKTKELLDFFAGFWEKGEPDLELRQLRL